jgi:hypothetical protein
LEKAQTAAGLPLFPDRTRKTHRREKAVCALMLISLVWGALSLLPTPRDEHRPSQLSAGPN